MACEVILVSDSIGVSRIRDFDYKLGLALTLNLDPPKRQGGPKF